MRRLRDAFGQALGDRSCQLFTILGSAGVGKSRLVAEFLGSLDGAPGRPGPLPPLRGGHHLLAGGRGAQAAPDGGADPAPPRRSRPAAATNWSRAGDEIAWAFRKQLEAVAAETPVVCVFDDVHWGEETFLDLVEHVADLSRDAPILLLCMARPELLDRRTGWAGGKVNATSVLLEPLAPRRPGG